MQRKVLRNACKVHNMMTHTRQIFGNSKQLWIFFCYEKGADALTESIVFEKRHFLSVSNRKVNLFYSWRCTTTTARHFIVASAWTLLSLILCSVKLAFALILLSLNFLVSSCIKHGNCVKMCQLIKWLCGVHGHVTNSSHVIGCFLRCLCQIRTCSITLARHILDLALHALHCMHKPYIKPCVACMKPCVSCVACIRLETGLNLYWFFMRLLMISCRRHSVLVLCVCP